MNRDDLSAPLSHVFLGKTRVPRHAAGLALWRGTLVLMATSVCREFFCISFCPQNTSLMEPKNVAPSGGAETNPSSRDLFLWAWCEQKACFLSASGATGDFCHTPGGVTPIT